MKNIRLLLILVCALTLNNVAAQLPVWENTINGTSIDRLKICLQTNDNGYLLGGLSWSGVGADKTTPNIGGSDYWIVKTDSNGIVQWDQTYGTISLDEFTTMVPSGFGGYLLGGYSNSINIPGNGTGQRYYIVKINDTGGLEWQKAIGGMQDDYLQMVLQNFDGTYTLAGVSLSGVGGDKTDPQIGYYDYWIVKIDAAGNITDQATIGGTDDDFLTGILATNDGGFLAYGWSESPVSGNKTEPTRGGRDYWVVKLDFSLNVQWDKTVGGGSTDQLLSVAQNQDNSYILCGFSYSPASGEKSESNYGNYDGWVVKLSETGAFLWDNTIGAFSSDELSKVIITPEGDLVLAGWSSAYASGDKTEDSKGGKDYWIIYTDSLSNFKWQKSLGGFHNDELNDALITNKGTFLLAGTSQSQASGDKSESSMGEDFWILNLAFNYNLITGKLFTDPDLDGIMNNLDQPIKYKTLFEQNTGHLGFSDQNGNYQIAVLDSGNYSVNAPPVNYYNGVPAVQNSYFSALFQTDSLNDFAYQPGAPITDLCVTITPVTAFRAGQPAVYQIDYINQGNTTVNNASIVFYPSPLLTYASSNSLPVMVSPDSVVWNIGTLIPFQTGSLTISCVLSTGATAGTVVISGIKIEPVAGDDNPTCNLNYIETTVIASMDPNDISVNRTTMLSTEFPTPGYLDYLIRFQNTGNDTAFYVRVNNPVEPKLDISSIEFTASSHPCIIHYDNVTSELVFTFNNILLPDSNVNEAASHGFIRYRIKPVNTLIAGDSIVNSARITFDYNIPVITNKATTHIVLPNGIEFQDQPVMKLFPNPVTELLTIQFPENYRARIEIELYNIVGEKVKSLFSGNPEKELKINTGSLPSGMYFLKVTGGINYSARIVKL